MLHNGLPLLLVGLASAANHDFAWTKGFSGQASDQTLTVAKGDTIKFTWGGSHNVYKMKGATDYGSCSFTEAVQEGTGNAGPVTVTVGSTDEYFACKVGAHCKSGQKLHVTVGVAPAGSCWVVAKKKPSSCCAKGAPANECLCHRPQPRR